MYKITHNGLLLAMGGSILDIPQGQQFFNNPEDMLQWATMNLAAGRMLQPHIHKVRERNGWSKTIEFVMVWVGRVMVSYFSNERELVCKRELKAGNFVCLYDGGHGFEITEDTRMIEVKLGKFTSVEDDKVKF